MNTALDKYNYLARINYVGELNPSLTVLAALQEAHLLSVPFENLDIHAGEKIILALPNLFWKIVIMKRGGFCYELNGLFHWLLQELGFHVKLAMGRAYDPKRHRYDHPFDHMINLVEVDRQIWLVDVGFGDFSMRPLEFTLNQQLTDKSGLFLIEKDIDKYFKVSRFSEKEQRYFPEYIFSTKERRLEDFSEMCLYHQTSPDSFFIQKRVCTVATLTGRVTLIDNKLIITDNGVRNESLISNELEFRSALTQYFNIIL